MSEQAEKLRLTLLNDGGGSELALKEVLRSELTAVFKQYMSIDNIVLDIDEGGVSVRVNGGDFRRVGFYSM